MGTPELQHDPDFMVADLLKVIAIQNEIVQAGSDLERIMSLVAARTRDLVVSDGAAVELQDATDMVYRATSGLADSLIGLRIAVEGSFSGSCVGRKQALVCGDAEIDARVDRDACRKVGLRSMVAVPLFNGSDAVGVLKLIARKPDAFGPRDARLIGLLSDIVSAAIRNAERLGRDALYIASTTDAMTGTRNRSYFYEQLRLQFKAALDSGEPFAVMVIDMDRLKTINDTLGHAFGDAALVELARSCRDMLREDDVFARLGGDEFGVIVPRLKTEADAEALANRISDRIARDGITVQGRRLPLSASVGYALFSNEVSDVQDLVSMADQRMYEMKDRRRSLD